MSAPAIPENDTSWLDDLTKFNADLAKRLDAHDERMRVLWEKLHVDRRAAYEARFAAIEALREEAERT